MTQNTDNQSVCNSQIANSELKCGTCPFMRGNVELAVDYCNHPKFGYISPIIEDMTTTLANCPLKQSS